MKREDIIRIIRVGRQPIIVSRVKLDKYNLYRDIEILDEKTICLDYNDINSDDENAVRITFEFVSFEDLIRSVSDFISQEIDEWTLFNYPLQEMGESWSIYYLPEEIHKEVDFQAFKKDFYDKTLDFPKSYQKILIGNFYWMALYNDYIKPDSSDKDFDQWFFNYIENEHD